jgi:hypothetical protein
VEVQAVHVTDTGGRARPLFVQMRGVARVEERGEIAGELPGFFETYLER